MFEREIKFIYDFNLNKVNKLGPYFTFEQLQNVDLHPAILNYISAEIDYLIFEDRQKLLKNSVFDYSGDKIAHHFNEITDEVKKIKRFSLEYIAKLILHATSFTVNYLVRPKWTLTRFVFDEAKYKSSNEIKQILNYVYYYKFVKKIIVSYINTKKILSMNAEEFEELLNRTDKLGMESNLKGIMSSSLISMAEFFNIGQMQKTRIPLTAVELFLEEKDLPLHLQKITDTFGTDENARFHIGDYMKILTGIMAEKKEEEPDKQEYLLFEEQEDKTKIIEEESGGQFFEEYEEPKAIASKEEEPAEETLEQEIPLMTEETPEVDTTEIISTTEEEITIKPNTKIRIKVNEDNKIEPVGEEELENIETTSTVNEPEELDTYSSVIKGYEEEEEIVEEEFKPQAEEETELKKSLFEIEEDDLVPGEVESETPFSGNNTGVIDRAYLEEDEEFQPTIKQEGGGKLTFNDEEEEEVIQRKFEEQTKLELAEVLEHKNMTKIIEVVFDYDIEDFATMLDEISECKNAEDAHFIINETLATRRINRNSKEAETLREIISEYFNRK
ncbi:MAG: hypothetical protein FD122_1035 [Stygiobacter sp.]|nr:MAG: hypothetical protein FD122_1035 [Stygiobacter sp.]KAF0214729.1 MAG: hypothetical protein FD178_2183 [Ignavibacteria bacterium]